MREARGASLAEIAAEVGGVHNTYVYQVEAGLACISPERYQEWADALGVDVRTFAIELLRFNDPITHRLLFEDE